MNDTHCLKCKKATRNTNVALVTLANGRHQMKSTCTACGGKKSRFITAAEGDGLLDLGKKLVNKILPTRENKFPPKVRTLIEQNANAKITGIRVCRNPVQAGVSKFMNIISLGGIDKAKAEMGYDNLYHLFLLIGLDNGNSLKFEKNEVVSLKSAKGDPMPHSSMVVPVNKSITFGELVNNVVSKVGAPLYLYNARSNNCQLFCINVLQSSGLLTSDMRTFIDQKADELMRGTPGYVDKIATVATDLGAKVDRLIQGEGVKKKRKVIKI